MDDSESRRHFVFPKWTNLLLPALIVAFVTGPLYLVVLAAYGASPTTTDVGYAPKQPVPYSHALHAGKLGLDCRYCHTTVERSAFAAIPPTQTCMNCHTTIYKDSERLKNVNKSYQEGMPIEWVKVHDLPDYVYFNHAAHVGKGVGCVECHGRVDRMEVVYQAKPLSMGWCLDCHRDPAAHLRPVDKITKMDWQPVEEARPELGRRLMKQYNIKSPRVLTDCSTCHR